MSTAGLIRLAGFAVSACVPFAALMLTRSWAWFGLALIASVGVSIVSERLYRRVATPDEQRRDLEDRVRNPPS